jgi:hypothetical protein
MFSAIAMPAVTALNSSVIDSRTKVLRKTLLVARADGAGLVAAREKLAIIWFTS